MPSTSCTHNNEDRLTKTIVIVNFCIVFTWLPADILSIYQYLYMLDIVDKPSADTRTKIRIANRIYLNAGFYFNGGLNSLIYTVRLARIRRFYKDAARRLFGHSNTPHEEDIQMDVVNADTS